MNIVQEKIDSLNSVLKIKLEPSDYKPKVDDALKKYSKKVNMPGFRPGMVPVGLVKKMYGKSVLFEEINRLVSESIDTYIRENNLQVLGNPLPHAENDLADMDLDKPSDFEFSFDMGIAPEVNLQLPPAKTFTYYEITVNENQVEEEISKLQRRHGEYTTGETVENESSVFGKFEELDETGNPVENGISHSSFILQDKIKDPAFRQQLSGKTPGDSLTLIPGNVFGEKDAAYLLGLKEENSEAVTKTFRVTIERIMKVIPADINQEFFDKIYGEGNVNSEEELKNKIREEIAEGYKYESENALRHDFEDYFLDTQGLELPDEFLKKWLKYSNEKITDDQLVKEYKHYSRDLKWKLIENKIFTGQNMEVTDDEIRNFARTMVIDQYVRYGQAHMLTEESLKDLVNRYISNRDSVQRIMESLTSRKVFEYLNQIVTKDVKPVSHEEFTRLMTEHQHTHHH